MAVERRLTEIVGAGRRQAAHRPLAQRPGRHRHGDVHPRARAAGDRGAAGPADRDRARRRGAPGLADARLHAPAARAAGVPLAPPAGLLLDVPARRRALRARAGLDDGAAARRGRAGGRELPDRPPAGGVASSASRASCRTRSTRSPTATSCSTSWPPPPPARRTCRGWARRSCCGPRRSSGSARCRDAWASLVLDHAAEEEPGRGRAAAREGAARSSRTWPRCTA